MEHQFESPENDQNLKPDKFFHAGEIEVSIVMPCLNEEATIGICIQKAKAALKEMDVLGEIIVADNGSTDASVEIAQSLGAKVVHQPIRGYGAAYLAGIAASKGKYIVIGDSDDTYDFSELGRFIQPLKEGSDLVMGSRFSGEILPGAMPWLHQYIGNPVLTGILNILSKANVTDAHCGMRAFTKEAYDKMELKTTGMEFASEIVIKAAKADLKITEAPITYYPREGESKLNSFRDGWRHPRFTLLYSPKHLFLIPGFILFLIGFIGTLLLLPGPFKIGGHAYDVHVMTVTSLLALLGFQVVLLAMVIMVIGWSYGFLTVSSSCHPFRHSLRPLEILQMASHCFSFLPRNEIQRRRQLFSYRCRSFAFHTCKAWRTCKSRRFQKEKD